MENRLNRSLSVMGGEFGAGSNRRSLRHSVTGDPRTPSANNRRSIKMNESLLELVKPESEGDFADAFD
jgi:hypothetical protein